MTTVFEEVYNQLPSPPLSPSKNCEENIELSDNNNGLINEELDSCKNEFNVLEKNSFFEEFLNSERFIYSDEEIEKIEAIIGSTIQEQYKPSREEMLREKYKNIVEGNIQIDNEVMPYSYALQKLHSIGSKIINKRTMDAIPIRAYEISKNTFQEFWVHPSILSLQTFQFFRLFEDIKDFGIQDVIEIEVPSLKSFPSLLYYLYTGDKSKILEVTKYDESFRKSILENIESLEINMTIY